jgi:tetratricopeptide (TPR) repeat protein
VRAPGSPTPTPASVAPGADDGEPAHQAVTSIRAGEGCYFGGRGATRLLGFLLFALVVGVFLPALRYAFIYYDDPIFVTENAHVLGGLTWANVKWAFLSYGVDYWRPLSWLSHMLDCQIFGLAPWGHHLTSVLLHAINAVLLFLVLRKMTGAVWRSWLVAAFFGLHPLHVESVAWIAERKDVLSALFWLLTIWAYAHWVQLRAARRPRASAFYGLALLFFALGLMSKPMLVTVPCALLLLDFWPLNRFGVALRFPASDPKEQGPNGGRERQGSGLESAEPGRRRPFLTNASEAGPGPASPATSSLQSSIKPGLADFAAITWPLAIEKIPFFVLAAGVGVMTVLGQNHVGALTSVVSYPWPDRIANALLAYCRYLEKCFCPTKLALFYPLSASEPVWKTVLAGAFLAGVTIAVCALYRRRSYLLMGWFWFLGTLLPVIGLVQVGEQSMADRYSYMSLVGVFIIVAWGAGDLAARWPRRTGLIAGLAGVMVVGCAVMTSRQLRFWKDSTTLFRHTIAVTENNWNAHTVLGYALSKTPGHLSEAVAEYRAALRIAPDIAVVHDFFAKTLAKIPGRESQAIAEFQAALRLDPNMADAHGNLAMLLAKMPGRLPEAIAEYRAALRTNPDSGVLHDYLAFALAKTPETKTEAVAEFKMALRLDPDLADAHSNLATVLMQTPGGLPEAIAQYEAALRLKPDSGEIHCDLGLALMRVPGRLPEAIEQFRAALKFQPESAETHRNLARALAEYPGGLTEAIAEYRKALQLEPGDAEAHYLLGLLLAGLPGKLPEAIAEYRSALRFQPADPNIHNALGNALSESPESLPEAVAEFRTALRLKPDFFQVHNNLGIVLSEMPGRLPDAVAEYEAALRANPNFAEAHNNLGNALSQMPGRQVEAIAEYDAALRIIPNYFEAHYNLGLLLSNIPGRRPDAIAQFETVLRIKPDCDPARTMLAKLRRVP